MSADANEYARLSSDSYIDRSEKKNSNKTATVNGVDYKILEVANHHRSGYQGTAYRRIDTGEVVIAHRGTEPNIKDATTDAGMVFTGHNSQLDEAVKFPERAMELAKQESEKKLQPLSIAITGHSLGGTLAEITAAKYGVHAETFNSYDPGALYKLERYGVDVRASHPNIVNHVRATDVVGSGGSHLGQVKTYAAPQDIENLRQGRYVGESALPRNPLLAADIAAHSIANFLPGNKTLGESVMNTVHEARARAYAGPIAKFSQDVMQGRIDLHTVANSVEPQTAIVSGVRLGRQTADAARTVAVEKAGQAVASDVQAVGQRAMAVGNAAGQAYDATRDHVESGVRRGGQQIELLRDGASQFIDRATRPQLWRSSQSELLLLTDPAHPGHAIFARAQGHLHKINAQYNIPCKQQTDNAAACVAAAGKQADMTRLYFSEGKTAAETYIDW